MVHYNKKMRIIYYTETHQIEILEEQLIINKKHSIYEYPSILYFNTINDLITLLKTSPKVIEELKQKLNEE